MIFYQNSIPNGWSLLTGVNDRTIRITNTLSQGGTSGGNVSFTSTFSQRGVPLPSHNHGIQIGGGNHSHDAQTNERGNHIHPLKDGAGGDRTNNITREGGNLAGQGRPTNWVTDSDIIGTAGAHTHRVQLGGGGHGHQAQIVSNGTAGASIDFRVTYINMILCQKS